MRIYFHSIGKYCFQKLAAKQALELVFFTPRKIDKVKEFKQKILKMGTAVFHFLIIMRSLLGYKWGDGNKNAIDGIHGWEGNSASLGGFVPGISTKSGYSIYAFDGLAHGVSQSG